MKNRVVISVLTAGLSLGLMTACGVDNNRMNEPQNQNTNYSPVRYENPNNNNGLMNGRQNMNQNGNNVNNGIDNNRNNRGYFESDDNPHDNINDNIEKNHDGMPGSGGVMMKGQQ
jgi:hypothetical protein